VIIEVMLPNVDNPMLHPKGCFNIVGCLLFDVSTGQAITCQPAFFCVEWFHVSLMNVNICLPFVYRVESPSLPPKNGGDRVEDSGKGLLNLKAESLCPGINPDITSLFHFLSRAGRTGLWFSNKELLPQGALVWANQIETGGQAIANECFAGHFLHGLAFR
jgi:hypothetical protein